MVSVVWSNRVGGLPQVNSARSVPKRPVIWFGEVWLLMPNGLRDMRRWRSKQKVARQQAQDILRQMLDDLIAEHGQDAAIDAGFRMECR